MDIDQGYLRDIFNVIELERARQEDKWGWKYNTPGEWILILEKKVAEAKDAWYFNRDGRDGAVSLINQIGAIAVAALEQHGTEFDLLKQYGEQE